MHEDFVFMVLSCVLALLLAITFFFFAHAQPQELGWLAQKQIHARQHAAEVIKLRNK